MSAPTPALPAAVLQVQAGQPLLVETFAGWREAARDLLVWGVPPEAVTWSSPQAGGDLFSSAPAAAEAAPPGFTASVPTKNPPHVPRSLMEMLQSAACCRVPDRWAFLYRVMWRWQQGEHDVQSPADEDGARLNAMVKAVRREEHDMHAYIRFRERPADAGAPRFVAWYEPRHDVLPQVADHFVSRMGKVSWMIATPEASVLWDCHTLHNTGPLAGRAEDLDQSDKDGGEALWLTYYRSIFNPARLNTAVMQQHITSDRWKNLPEGKIVPHMISEAAMGARKIGQAQAVGQRKGTTIPIAPADAQPERQQPTKLDECRRCELWQFATQAVPGEGPQHAPIMFVGEQPGDQEDLAGHAFIGPAGKLLDQVCAAAGVDRGTIYVTNAVKHFKWEPRGKRRIHKTPAQREVDACNPWLRKELADVAPEVVVALGSTALRALTGRTDLALSTVQGQALRLGECWLVPTWHPSYVLRLPGQQEQAAAFDAMRKALQLAKSLLAGQAEPV